MRVLIKNGIVVNADGRAKQDLLIENGLVSRLAHQITLDQPCDTIDAEGCYVMPGGIDVHTHFNIDTGLARSCDDFLPVPAPPRVAVQQPSSIIWASALPAVGYATSWRPTTDMPLIKR